MKPNDPKSPNAQANSSDAAKAAEKANEPSPADEIAADASKIALSDDPFSADNEVTVIQVAEKIVPVESSDDVTEITDVDGKAMFFDDIVTEPRLKNPFKNKVIEKNEEDDGSVSASVSGSKSQSVSSVKIKISLPKLPWDWARPAFVFVRRLSHRKTLKFLGGLSVLLAIVWLANIGWQRFGPSVSTQKQNTKKTEPVRSKLHLSRLEFIPQHNKPTPLAVRAGSTFEMRYAIDQWPKPPKDDLNFVGDLRIYTAQGKLLHYNPQYVRFFGRANVKTENVEIEHTVRLQPKTPPGVYRLMFGITEMNTNERASLQTRIQVLPQE